MLPPATVAAWRKVAPVLPEAAYLAGGTAIAVHLAHRVSRDLDFFVSEPFDVAALSRRLEGAGNFAPTTIRDDTLNGVLDACKVQILLAADQAQLRPTTEVEGIAVASLEDLLATKLRAVGGRGELRDYFDVMTIERRTELTVEEGLGLYVTRYHPDDARSSLEHIVRALGYLDDVADDPGLPVSRRDIEKYWRRRSPQLARSLSTWAPIVPGQSPALSTFDLEELVTGVRRSGEASVIATSPSPESSRTMRGPAVCGAWMPRARKRCVLPPHPTGHHRSVR